MDYKKAKKFCHKNTGKKTHKNSDMSILESDKVLFKVGSKRHKGHFIKIKRSIQLLVKLSQKM